MTRLDLAFQGFHLDKNEDKPTERAGRVAELVRHPLGRVRSGDAAQEELHNESETNLTYGKLD